MGFISLLSPSHVAEILLIFTHPRQDINKITQGKANMLRYITFEYVDEVRKLREKRRSSQNELLPSKLSRKKCMLL